MSFPSPTQGGDKLMYLPLKRFVLCAVAYGPLFWAIFAALLPYRNLAFTDNEGIYGAVAQELGHGARLYTDVWDHKPPLIYLEYEAIQKFFGTSEKALHDSVAFCHGLCNVDFF